MANNLYEEAIDAAAQIREAAEHKVKQQLVEAMSPKIKTLIEKSLMGEELDEISDSAPLSSKEDDQEKDQDEKDSEEEKDQDEKDTKECGTNENLTNKLNTINEVEISSESAEILNRMISATRKKDATKQKLSQIEEGIKSLRKAILIAEGTGQTKNYKTKFAISYKTLLRELKFIGESDIIKKDKSLLREYLKISKELSNMSTRRRKARKSYLNESLEDLLEMNIFEDEEAEELSDLSDEGDEEEMSDEVSDEMPDEGDEDDEDDEDDEGDLDSLMSEPLEDILKAALKGMGEEDDSDLDLDVAEEADSDKDGLDEIYEVDEMAELAEEVDEMAELAEEVDEMQHESLKRGKDLFLEIDENMLKKEITKMRRLREGEASAMASHFGGGKLDKEMFVDVDDGDLNVHSDVLGREDVPMPKVEAALRKAVRSNRMLESKIRQYKNAVRGMKTQLSEMNLFNAKLLYANKLMQNRDLSMKQQRQIVESLDEASTLNEAKLLFESLSKSLSKPSRKSRKLSEGANRRTLTSASRSTKSGQTLNENVALDRWATLAGIK